MAQMYILGENFGKRHLCIDPRDTCAKAPAIRYYHSVLFMPITHECSILACIFTN